MLQFLFYTCFQRINSAPSAKRTWLYWFKLRSTSSISRSFAEQRLRKFIVPSSQDAANALWALATLQARPSTELLSYLLIRVQAHFGSLKPCEVAATLWALSELEVTPPSSWLKECLARQVGRQQWQHTEPRHYVMVLMACARMKQVGVRT